MNQFKIIFLMIVASMLFYGCEPDDDGHQFITIINNSDNKVRVQEVWSSKISNTDTLWRCGHAALSLESNTSRMFESLHHDWEEDFNYIPFIQFLVFDAEVYDSMRDYDIPCSEVDYTIPVLHYYQLKLEDLERMNWEVMYPPSEE